MTVAATKSKAPRLRLLGAIAWIAVIGAAAQVLFALLWRDGLHPCSRFILQVHYWAFMAQVFVYHAGIAMVPIALFAAITRRRRMLITSVLVLIVGGLPELMQAIPRAKSDSAGAIKIMSVNLMYGHGDAGQLLQQIRRESPDVLVLQEWTEEGAAKLRSTLREMYAHRYETARTDAFGQAVFSRLAFTDPPREYPPVPGFAEPQIGVGVVVGERVMRIENVHLLAPTGLGNFNEQRRSAAALAAWVSDTTRGDRPDVMVGDFNATCRTFLVGTLLHAGMRDAHTEAGWWRGSTWPRVGTLQLVPGIQLDHALCGPRVQCVEARTGEDFGSDHRPVIVRVRWRSRSGE